MMEAVKKLTMTTCEARTKICPYALNQHNTQIHNCRTTQCMAWQQVSDSAGLKRAGFCWRLMSEMLVGQSAELGVMVWEDCTGQVTTEEEVAA